ncbi:MAG: hypothetical protein V4507_11700 [Verrucomicrobiota bacterium]
MKRKPIGSIQNKGLRGVALLMSLSFIVFLTLLMMAFFSRALLQRKISSASTNVTKTDMMARSCLDLIVGELKGEVYAGSTVYGRNGINDKTEPFLYLPTANTNILVQRSGVTSKSEDQINLVKVSGSQPIYSINGQQGRITGSSVGTDQPSLNGKMTSKSQWQNGPFLVKEMENIPTWAILTRSGVKSQWEDDFSKKNSQTYAVGRFAYAIYDVSGLMDMNVAGYPKDLVTATGTVNTKMLRQKGSLGWSSLDSLENGIFPMSLGASQNLVKWRLKKTSSDAALYTNYIYGFGATNGFLKTIEGDNLLLGRREIIRMAKKEGFKEALPVLTTFTREKNAPSFTFPTKVPTGESSNYPVDGRLAKNTATSEYPNKNWFGYRFTKNGTSPEATTQVTWNPGDPLLLRRFSLDRLSWLTFKGPSASLSSEDPLYKAEGTDANIRYYFGLTWDSSNAEWIYCGSNGGTSAQAAIKTLSAIVSENREPNFFELLKAFIHTDVIGLDATGGDLTLNYIACQQRYLIDRQGDLQILKIGANIIDQADTDDYPTIISYRPSVSGFGGVDVKADGIENLPYISKLSFMPFNPNWPEDFLGAAVAPADFSNRKLDVYCIPELSSPHQTNQVVSVSRPENIRLQYSGNNTLTRQAGVSDTATLNTFSSQADSIVIPQAGFKDYYPAPRRIRSVSGVNGMTPGAATTGAIFVPVRNVVGDYDFKVLGGKFPTQMNVVPTDPTKHDDYVGVLNANTPIIRNYVGRGMIGFDAILQYQNYKGSWKTYSRFAGADSSSEAFNQRTSMGNLGNGLYMDMMPVGQFKLKKEFTAAAAMPTGTAHNINYGQGNWINLMKRMIPEYDFFKTDVRTSRLDVGKWYQMSHSEMSIRPDPISYPLIIQQTKTALIPILPAGALASGWFDLGSYSFLTATTTLEPSIYPGIGKGRGWAMGMEESAQVTAGANSLRRIHNATPYQAPNTQFMPAMLSENRLISTSNSNNPDTFYYDHGPDIAYNTGRVRPADSALIGRYTGLNDARLAAQRSIYNNVNAMPVILNRPFRSVGELGHVFMDLPYRSLDFFSSESANAGLLDVFTVDSVGSEVTVTAGRLNPNSSHPAVLAATLKETGRNEEGDRFISNAEANVIAQDLIKTTTGAQGAFATPADLVIRGSGYKVGAMNDNASVVTVSGFEDSNDSTPYPSIKREREAPIRAFSSVANTRTWNLLIDVIVQSGRYSEQAKDLKDFALEGQRRYWLHVAIDRFTGEVLDRQLEPVD